MIEFAGRIGRLRILSTYLSHRKALYRHRTRNLDGARLLAIEHELPSTAEFDSPFSHRAWSPPA